MAVRLLAHEVSDLCLGKPALRSLSISATIGDALSALKITGDNYISVWSCDHYSKNDFEVVECCCCIGKVCMVDVVCYLSREENLLNPSSSLKSPVSVLLPKVSGIIRHVEPHSSLLEAVDLILEGAQNLVVPIKNSVTNHSRKRLLTKSSSYGSTLHNGREFCWLTEEDVMRFLLNLIGIFSPMPTYSVESLGIIRTDVLAIEYHNPASSAIDAISSALTQQTSVAVVDKVGKLIGEISPFTLANCEETVAAAITTLSAGDLMSYIDCGGPPEDLIRVVKARLTERNLKGMLDLMEDLSTSSASLCSFLSASSSSSSSSDEECPFPTHSLNSGSTHRRSGSYSESNHHRRSSSYSARLVRRSEAIVCHPGSSLVAVIVQALAHRVNYVWVMEEDYSLAGIITFSDILKVLREKLTSIGY